MNSAKPPRLATWLLQDFGPRVNGDALAGDLWEAFQQGRSKAWYWRQVLAAVRWSWLLFQLLVSVLMGWWMTTPMMGARSFLLNRRIDMALITAVFFAGTIVPGMVQRRLRVLLALLIAAVFALVWRYDSDLAAHYSMFFWIVGFNFVLYSERPALGPYRLTIRELLFGDPDAERQRLVEKLQLAMLQETDPQVRHAYAESIAALKSKLPAAKAVE